METQAQINDQVTIPSRDPICIGYVIIPSDVDRLSYLTTVHRTGTISVLTENNEVIWEVKCSVSILDQIEFPQSSDKLGSAVVLATVNNHNAAIAIAVVAKNGDVLNRHENVRSITNRSPLGSVEICSDTRSGSNLIIQSASQINGRATIVLLATGPQKTGVIRTMADNIDQLADTFELDTETAITLKVASGEKDFATVVVDRNKITISDSFDNSIVLDSNGVKISANKIAIGGSDHSSVFGDVLFTELNKSKLRLTTLLNAIQAAPVTPGDGGASFKAFIVAAISALIEEDYSNIQSSKVSLI